MEVTEIISRMKRLSSDDRYHVLIELLKDDKIPVSELIVAKVSSLERFKQDAKRDINRIAEAGMELGEKEMRAVTKIKGKTRKKTDSFMLAMVKCLVDAGAYRGSIYGDKLASVDYSSVDEDWYKHAWQPKTSTVLETKS